MDKHKPADKHADKHAAAKHPAAKPGDAKKVAPGQPLKPAVKPAPVKKH